VAQDLAPESCFVRSDLGAADFRYPDADSLKGGAFCLRNVR